MHHLECIGFDVDQDEQESVFRCQEGAVFVNGKPACGPWFPIHPPCRHPGVECGLEGRDQLLKLVERQAREIQELRGAGLYIGKPDTGHLWCLLSWEAQYIINRDNLNGMSPTTAYASLAHNAHGCSTSIIHARDRAPVASRGHRLHAGGLSTHRVTIHCWTT